jgi:Fe-S-cluster containining protein
MPDQPWYQDGLRFKCTQCGNCCTGAPGVVWVNQEEIEALAKTIDVDVETFVKKYVRRIGNRQSLVEFANGDCVFFDNQARSCTVYDARPRQCRTWPFWQSNVKSPEAWEETKEACPGCGHGKLYPVEQIIEQVRVIRV